MGLILLDNQFLGIARALVQQAKQEIRISTFKLELNDKPRGLALKKLFEDLTEKIKAGVKVKILFNWNTDRRSVPKTNLYASCFLRNAGADVRYLKNNRCCHAKLLIVDTEKVLLGSHNLSVRSIANNFELSYLIPDPETVTQVSAIFNTIFDGAEKI